MHQKLYDSEGIRNVLGGFGIFRFQPLMNVLFLTGSLLAASIDLLRVLGQPYALPKLLYRSN